MCCDMHVCVGVGIYAHAYENQITLCVIFCCSLLYPLETVPLMNVDLDSQLVSPKDPPVSVPYSAVTTGMYAAVP